MTDDAKSKSSEVEIILEKRLQKQTKRDNVTTLGGNVNQLIELRIASLATETLQNDEYTPSNYQDAALSSKWIQSILTERNSQDKRGCWRIDKLLYGVKLIRSRYFHKRKKDWTSKVVEWKSRLVILR